ncbi:hypothetical protein [Nonomuraea salmonea]|uniref:hypothetical protein n=1 Tax=Nonomuraea salmonea TaxID=46181 RepID=UPI002FEB097B
MGMGWGGGQRLGGEGAGLGEVAGRFRFGELKPELQASHRIAPASTRPQGGECGAATGEVAEGQVEGRQVGQGGGVDVAVHRGDELERRFLGCFRR